MGLSDGKDAGTPTKGGAAIRGTTNPLVTGAPSPTSVSSSDSVSDWTASAPPRARRTRSSIARGRLVGGVVAAVLVLAAAIIGGFFVGRETADNGTPEAEVDTALAVNAATRLNEAVAPTANGGSTLVMTPTLLSGEPTTDLEAQTAQDEASRVEGLFRDTLGTSALEVQAPKITIIDRAEAGATKVRVTGDADMHGLPTTLVGTLFYVDGVLHMGMEHYPKHADWKLSDIAATDGTDIVLPNVSTANAAFVLSSFTGQHSMAGASVVPGGAVAVSPGLNLVTTMRAVDSPVVDTLMSTTAPATTGQRRRLSAAAAAAQPLTAGTITTLTDKWFKAMEVRVAGAVRPLVNLTADNLPSLQFNKNLDMHNITMHSPEANGNMAFNATSTLTLGSSPPVTVAMSGTITNTSYKFKGVLANMTLGPASSGLHIHDVVVTATGARGPAMPTSGVTYHTTVDAKLFLSGVEAAFHVELPLADGTVDIHVENITLDNNVVLHDVVLKLSPTTVAAAAKVSIATHLADAEPITADVSIAFDDGIYSLDASLSDWTLPIGPHGVDLKSLQLIMSGPASLRPSSNVADPEFSLLLSANTQIGDIDFDAKLTLPATSLPDGLQPSAASLATPANVTTGVTFDLTVTNAKDVSMQTAIDATLGSGATPLSKLPVASSTLDSMKHTAIQSVTVAVSTAPLSLLLKGTINVFKVDAVDIQFVAQRVNCSWEFGVGAALTAPFKFSDVVPSDTGFDYIPFATGMVVVSTSNATFTMSTGGVTSATLATSAGVALTATIPFKTLSERLVADGTWTHVESVTVTGSFGFSTHDLAFSVAMPPNLPLTKDLTLLSGNMKLASTNPRFTLHAAAALDYSSTALPLDASLSGALGEDSYALTASINNWHIGATGTDKGVTVTDASLNLDGTKDGSSGNWTTTGSVSGDVTMGSVILKAVIDLPITKDHLDIQVPDLQLSKDVRLTNIDFSKSGDDYHLAGTANITFNAMDNLVFAATASIKGDDITATGTIEEWTIGGAHGVKCTDVELDLSGKYSAASGPQDLTGTLTGKADFFGVNVDFSVDLPMATSGKLVLTVSHIDFGHNVELDTVTLTVQRAEPKYALAAQATIGTGLKNDDLQLAVSGWLIPSAGNFTVAGTMANWDISSDFSIANLAVNVTGTRKAGAATGTDLSGSLTGEMKFDDITVDVEAALPAESLTVSFPTLKLSHDVTLKDVSMTATGSTPSFSFTGTAVVDTKQPTPLTMTATGLIEGHTFDLNATLASWTIDVGHQGFTVTDLALNIKDAIGAKSFTGSLSGDLDFDSTTMRMAATIPGSPEGGLVMKLTLATGQHLTAAKAVSATCGSSALSGAKAPSSTLDGVKDKEVVDLTMFMITKPPLFNFSGTVKDAWSLGDSNMDFVATQEDSTWKWGFAVALERDLQFSDVAPGNTDFNFLPFVGGGVAIANFAYDFSMTAEMGTLSTVDGVAFLAMIPLEHLKQHLDAATKWGESGDIRVNGSFTTDSHDLALEGQLPPNLPLGSTVTLNATVLLQQKEPNYNLDASAHITFHEDVDPVTASVDVSFGDDGKWHITGTAEHYDFKLGKQTLDGKKITLDLTDEDNQDEFAGSLAGVIQFQHPAVEMAFNFSVPSEDNGKGGMSLELSLAPGDSITFSNLIKTSLGDQDMSLPHDFSSVLSTRLLSAGVKLTTKPPSIDAHGTMSLFHFDHPLVVQLGIQSSDDGHFSWGVGIAIGQPFGIGQVITKQANSKANEFKFGSGGVVVTNSHDGWTFNVGKDTPPITMNDGIAIQGDMNLGQGKLSTVQKWAKVDALVLKASFQFDDHDFRLEADLDADWKIGSKVEVTQASLFMDIGGPHGFDMGIGCALAATIGSKNPATLDFESDIVFSVDDLKFDAEMSTPWKEPFGIKGVVIGDTEIMLGISYAGVPDAFGFSGSLQIGSEKGGATVYVDAGNPVSTVIAARLNKFNMGELLDHLTDNLIPSFLTKTIFDIAFTDLSLEINLGTEALHFDGKTFDPGFRFSVKQFVMWGITGSLTLDIGERSFYLNADVNPIKIGHNGDILSLSGYDCDTCAAKMVIALGAGHMPGKMFISGQASLLSLLHLDASVNISDAGVDVFLQYSDSILELTFKLNAPGLKQPTDFSLFASVQQKLLDYLGTNVVDYLKKAKESADSKLDEAKDKVKDWEESKKPKMDANTAKINELKKEEEDKAEEPEHKLADAKSKLSSAEHKVDGLQDEINKYDGEKETCKHWYDVSCKAHNGWLDTKIAALWVAKHAADAALDVAKGAVDVAEKAVDDADKIVANLKPEVLKLEAENAAYEVAYKAAEAGLSAAKAVTNAALDTVDFAVEAIADIFNIEEMWIEAGSCAHVRDGGKLSVGMRGKIIGKSFEWMLSIDFPPKVDDMLKSVWDKVKDDIHL